MPSHRLSSSSTGSKLRVGELWLGYTERDTWFDHDGTLVEAYLCQSIARFSGLHTVRLPTSFEYAHRRRRVCAGGLQLRSPVGACRVHAAPGAQCDRMSMSAYALSLSHVSHQLACYHDTCRGLSPVRIICVSNEEYPSTYIKRVDRYIRGTCHTSVFSRAVFLESRLSRATFVSHFLGSSASLCHHSASGENTRKGVLHQQNPSDHYYS